MEPFRADCGASDGFILWLVLGSLLYELSVTEPGLLPLRVDDEDDRASTSESAVSPERVIGADTEAALPLVGVLDRDETKARLLAVGL